MIPWGNKAIEVRAKLVPRFLWTTASIDVFLAEKSILSTGGQGRFTGSHSAFFEEAGLKHRVTLNWGRSWGFWFPYQLSIDDVPITAENSKVRIENWPMASIPIFLLVLLGSSLIALCALSAGCSDSGFDKARYDKMQHAISTSRSNMLGMEFADASKLLKLDGVKWDRGYDNLPLGEWRIYHFEGFYLALHLSVRPKSVRLGEGFSYTNEPELRNNGVWWVDAWEPRLNIDGLRDPKQRMSNYWAEIEKNFQIRGKTDAELSRKNNSGSSR